VACIFLIETIYSSDPADFGWRLGTVIVGAVGIYIFVIYIKSYWFQHSAVVYEGGLVLERKGEARELDFNDIEGILVTTNTRMKELIVARGLLNKITIVKKDDTEPIIFYVPKFREFAKAFSCAFTNHLVKDLCSKNIKQANISFGKYLKLVDGHFIYEPEPNDNREHKMTMPFNAVTDVEVHPKVGYFLAIIGVGAERISDKNKVLIPKRYAEHMLNLDTLYHILKKKL